VLEQNHDFAHASGKFQLACYKEEIEANLRTPGMAGFQLLDLHDYTGQGTALIACSIRFGRAKAASRRMSSKSFATPSSRWRG